MHRESTILNLHMSRSTVLGLAVSLCLGFVFGPAARARDLAAAKSNGVPIRGLHLSAPMKSDLPALLDFVRMVLPKEGVNTLILEFDFNYDFRSRPEFANPAALGIEDVKQIVRACRENRIALIPQINCLGHQSWAKRTDRLLREHPEFDETPGKHPSNDGIYCRSYCPLHPRVHEVLFGLIDELARACEAKAFHVGMDEVFVLADRDCPRCSEKKPADLFAGEVKLLRNHLKSIGCRMWMWGDRFLDAKSTGLGKWEASENDTASAIDHVPKDIVICDWHYDAAPETPQYFARKGFAVVGCPWRKPAVALAQLNHIRAIAAAHPSSLVRRSLGMVQTTWCGSTPFIRAYGALAEGETPVKKDSSESAYCFISLFRAFRSEQAP